MHEYKYVHSISLELNILKKRSRLLQTNLYIAVGTYTKLSYKNQFA